MAAGFCKLVGAQLYGGTGPLLHSLCGFCHCILQCASNLQSSLGVPDPLPGGGSRIEIFYTIKAYCLKLQFL